MVTVAEWPLCGLWVGVGSDWWKRFWPSHRVVSESRNLCQVLFGLLALPPRHGPILLRTLLLPQFCCFAALSCRTCF